MEFPGFFSYEKWYGTEFRGFVASEKWFLTEFRSFSLTRNRRNSDGTVVCSVLFRITWNNFFVGKWQPYPQGKHRDPSNVLYSVTSIY
jgi:hypothetical protein